MFSHGYSILDRGLLGSHSSSIWSTGGIIMLVSLAVLIGLVIYFAVTRNRSPEYHRYSGYHGYQSEDLSENPVNIAKLRYAKGDITKDELDDILKRLK